MRTVHPISIALLLGATALTACAPPDEAAARQALVLGGELSGLGPHVELPEVVAQRDFCTPLTVPGFTAAQIAIRPGQRIGALLSWDSSHACFAGRLRSPGAYRFEILVGGARRLAHLVAQPSAGPADELRDYSGLGPHATGATTRTLVFSAPIAGATQTTLVVHYPSTVNGTDVPVDAGSYPLLVLGHGAGYHADEYDELGERLASWGIVFAVPETPNLSGMNWVGGRAAYVREAIAHLRAAGASASDLFATHIGDGLVIAGHSWGGAAADLAMFDAAASLYVMFDPVALMHDPAGAQDTLGVMTGAGPYLAPVATLVVDATLNVYDASAAAYAGLYRGPSIHASLSEGYHQSFLDHDAPMNAMHPLALTQAFHAAAAHYIVAAVQRYVLGDVGAGGPLFASAGLASYPYAITVAARRPSATDWIVDDFADAALGTSLVGGTVSVTGATASLTHSLAADAWCAAIPSGVPFESQPEFQQLRLTGNTGAAVVSLDLPSASDVRDQRKVAVDIARGGGIGLVQASIGLTSGSTTQWIQATGSLPTCDVPGTVSVPLASFTAVDLAAVTRVSIQLDAPIATLDDVRFVR